MTRSFIRTSLPLIALAGISAAANADTLHFVGTGLGSNVDISINGSKMSVFAGQLDFKINSSSSKTVLYCADLLNTINVGQSYSVDVTNTGNAANPATVQKAGRIYSYAMSKGVSTTDAATALQLSIWSELYGNKFSFKGTSSSVNNLVNADLASGPTFAGDATYYKTSAGCQGQSQIGGNNPVPEPASLLAIGLSAVAAYRRRHSK